MAIQITPMQESDIDSAIICIQLAFAEDPYNHWIFDRATFSEARNRASLRTRCVWGLHNALFHVAKDPSSSTPSRVLGVACWLPPSLASLPEPATWSSYITASYWNSYVSSWSLWTSQLLTNLRYLGRGGLVVQRYWIWKQAQAVAQGELWDDPMGYYFCNIVTVLPEVQGRGIGKAMVQVVTDRADREGRKCYLESSRRVPNVAIYKNMGFELRRELECKEGKEDKGITLFCMIREPKTKGQRP